MGTRFRWKNNSLMSLELRDGTYVLLQMLDRTGWVAVLDQYRDIDEWDGIHLEESDVLFITCTTRGFLSRSRLKRVQCIKQIDGLSAPSLQTTLNTESHWREVTLWPGTEDEITILADGGPGNVGLYSAGRKENGELVDIFEKIGPEEYKKYEHLETAHLSDYATFNERLLLCKGKGWNFDPIRNLMFDWPLDRECSVFAQLLSGKVQLDSLGYTTSHA